MFLNEEPQHAGTICMEIVPLRMAAMISSRVRESGSSKYFSIRVSSHSAAASRRMSLQRAASPFRSAGISPSL